MKFKWSFLILFVITLLLTVVIIFTYDFEDMEKRFSGHLAVDVSKPIRSVSIVRQSDRPVDQIASQSIESTTLNSLKVPELDRYEPQREEFLPLLKRLFEIGVSRPSRLIEILDNEDPFHISQGPPSISNASQPWNITGTVYRSWADDGALVNTTAAELFRCGNKDSFIYYQHLRKAGGTGFCAMAKTNMAPKTVPPYYCMPDNRGSLATPPWRERSYLLDQMHNKGYRIASNEWDVFYWEHATIPGAVLATTSRHPIDRWYSQYVFEHVERRDGSAKDAPRNPMRKWYDNNRGWTMGSNYYVKTFIGLKDEVIPKNTGHFYWTYSKFQKKSISFDMFMASFTNIRRFNLVLVTEWLSSSAPLIKDVLAWTSPPKKVLPHEVQALRNGAASKSAKASIPAEDYAYLMQDNVLDLLMFCLMKRIFLERLSAVLVKAAG